MCWVAHPVPPFPDMHGGVPALGAHVAKADAGALPTGFAQPPSGYMAQPNGKPPMLPPRRLVQSWAVYSEPGDGGQRGNLDAACVGLRGYGAVDGQARGLQGLADLVTQPSGRATADGGQAHCGMREMPRACARAAAQDVSACIERAAVAPLGQAALVPDDWAVGGGAAAFMDVCDEEGLGAFGGGGAGFGPGGAGAGFPDLPGIANESELAAVLGLLPPAAAQHAARLTAAGPRLIEEVQASGGSVACDWQSQVCRAGVLRLAHVHRVLITINNRPAAAGRGGVVRGGIRPAAACWPGGS